MTVNRFSAIDYSIFAIMLAASGVIGLFFAWKHRRMSSTTDYLLANRSITWFPLFVSLVATFFSAVGVMGIPSQIYTTGITFALHLFCFIPIIAFSAEVFVPIFRGLNMASANEYLELRFSRGVRYLGCFFFHLQYVLYMSVVLYAPSLALQSVSGVPVPLTILATGFVCTCYTSLGGMRAVIWTDVFQSAVMLFGLLYTVILGVKHVGSFSQVLRVAEKMGRLRVDFSPDPRAYHSVWGAIIGMTFTLAPAWTIAQPTVQRIVSAKSINHARGALFASMIGVMFILGILSIDALVIFAVYSECDLMMDKKINKNDEIMPYFVADKFSRLPGVPGLFTACLFSFALSTLSSGLNGVSALLVEDVVKSVWPNMSETGATRIGKISAFVCGLIVVGFAFIVPILGTFVAQLTISIFGFVGGPYMSIFLLGVFTTRANKYGAYAGSISGLLFSLWLTVGQQFYPPNKQLKPVSIANCQFFNSSSSNSSGIIFPPPPKYDDNIAKLYGISYVWLGSLSILVTVVIGLLVSFAAERLGKHKQGKVDERLQYQWRSGWIAQTFGCYVEESHISLITMNSVIENKETTFIVNKD